MQFRRLTADEVEARVGAVSKTGLTLLLYKDARCDMRVLDETVGAENWQREHYECKGNLFCRVGINCDGSWVWKSDCGTESRTEAEKGEASDSFKRACFNWGIGRELYTAPFIWIPTVGRDGSANYDLDAKGRPQANFVVTGMASENGRITALQIDNSRKRRTVFTYGSSLSATAQCCVCGKAVAADFAEKSREANDGKVYCSGSCKNKG